MAWHPIAHTLPQYVDGNGDPHSGAVLKAYANGTSSNISMATDATGGTTATSMALNASGYPEVSGNEVIPHVQESYKLSLYPTQAAADLDSGALWTIDELTVGPTYDEDYVVDTGAADAIVITPSPPIPAYAAGQKFAIKIIATNTGAATANANGLGPVAIKKDVSSALTAGDLTIGEIAVIQHDGTNFQLISTKFGADLNGAKLILDADGDTSITADTDDTIDIEVGGADVVQITGTAFDVNGLELILDADGDTSLHASTDDQIDIKIGGTDRVVIATGMQVGAPTGGDKGADTFNSAGALYRNGLRIGHGELVDEQTASTVATINFGDSVSVEPTLFKRWMVEFTNIVPATDAATTRVRIGDGSFSAAANYHQMNKSINSAGTDLDGGSSGNTQWGITNQTSNVAAEAGQSGWIVIEPLANGWCKGFWFASGTLETGNGVYSAGAGIYAAALTEVDRFQFFFSAGDIVSGTFSLWGIR